MYDDLSLRHGQLQADHITLRLECDALRAENAKLKAQLQMSASTCTTAKGNSGQLVFFTGLTPVVFQWLLAKLTDSVDRISEELSKADHLLVVLMKLRLGLCNTDLACRFNVSKTALSNILRSWIPAMAVVLKPLIKWPSRGAVLRNMPKAFKHSFKRCRCILHCTEVSVARPGSLTARAPTWSNSKHDATVKYLIAVTPAGAVSFLSSGRAGRVSVKQIASESGFGKLLEPKDEVLADRGVLIRDELAPYGATLRTLRVPKGQKPLSAQETDYFRQLSRVRMHVRRVIDWWENFRILQTVIPVSQVNMLDDVVTVCGALNNLCKRLAPQ